MTLRSLKPIVGDGLMKLERCPEFYEPSPGCPCCTMTWVQVSPHARMLQHHSDCPLQETA